jgi:ATP-dependent helicase/nuclease subunit B
MDPFVTQLAELCRAEPTRAKWLIVPGHGLGHTLAERVVREGTSWANLRVTTPLDLALQMAAPALVARGIDPAPDALGAPLILRLALELPAATATYFRPLVEQPGMAAALWRAIRELRLAGLAAADLRPAAFDSARKHAELAALLGRYERHLETERLADAAGVYQEALAQRALCPVAPDDRLLEAPHVCWALLERRFLDALPGVRLPAATRALPGLTPPRRLALLAGPAQSVTPPARSDAARLAWLMDPGAAPPPARDGTLALFRAGGREAEVEEVFRRVAALGVPLDHVEVVCAHAELGRLVWEKAERHGWAVTLADGLPITETRPARALLGWAAWIERGFPATDLRRLLESGDVRLPFSDGPTAGRAARLLARTGATWGRDTYGPALDALAARERTRAADPTADATARADAASRAAEITRLRQWVADLVADVPAGQPTDPVALGALLDAATRFVRTVTWRGSARDGAAAVALEEGLAELRPLADLHRSLAEGLRLVREAVAELRVEADRARPGCLHVATFAGAGAAGRPHTFVLGLEEGRVLPPGREDPVLLDAERAALAPTLATAADRSGEALWRVVARLAALGGHVTLSCACRDLREGRTTYPSWLLLQAQRLVGQDPALGYGALDRALGEPVSPVPAGPAVALDDAGWWLAQLRERVGPGAVSMAFPALARGAAALAARASDLFTAHDGAVPAAAAALDPSGAAWPVSATGLERAATCPFRYFLEQGLGVWARDEAEPDADHWLDPATRGQVLHALYARILRELRAEGAHADPRRHGPRFRALGEAALATLRVAMPPPSAHVFQRESEDILRDLDLFLRLEAERTGREPIAFEVSFGAGRTAATAGDAAEPLARAEPVRLDLGGGLRLLLRGAIDRIDSLADGSYEVIDYKTGRPFLAGGPGAPFAGGRQLQHALYALVAAELLRATDPGARVTAGVYYFPSHRGGAEEVRIPHRDGTAVARVLRDLVATVRAGAFLHTPKADECRFCDLGRACGDDAPANAERKLARAATAGLQAYARLRTHA